MRAFLPLNISAVGSVILIFSGVSLAIFASVCVAEPLEEEVNSSTREAKGRFKNIDN